MTVNTQFLTDSSWFVKSTRFCRHFAAACLLRSRRTRWRCSSSEDNCNNKYSLEKSAKKLHLIVWLNVSPNTKWIILETFFTAKLLAGLVLKN